MFTPWDFVRPRFWYPMSSLEQSMMELEHMSDVMAYSRFPFDEDEQMLAAPSNVDDDDFFRDLPVKAREQKPRTQHKEVTSSSDPSAAEDKDAQSNDKDARAYSSYSFTNSSIVDDKGQRVTSTRRRYEDSTGRLKAVHERQLGDKKLRTVWNRQNKEDEGKHESICSSGNADEFEALWQTTPFGEAQKKTIKEQQQQPEEEATPKAKPLEKMED